MPTPAIHTLTLPGAMLQRGFWLYVWLVETPRGEMLYVGRTGDNSSPHATAPYTRMGQHLGHITNQNALRQKLERRGIKPENCATFKLIACGPLYQEVARMEGWTRDSLMAEHKPIRNVVGAIEKALAEALTFAGYDVLNVVNWTHALDDDRWRPVLAAFVEHFPKLSQIVRRAQ